jgi:hypothetical protein
MTPLLQPLGVAITFPFKAALRSAWEHWHHRTSPIFTRKGYSNRPSYDEVVKIVGQACKEVQAKTKRRAFECCGIQENGQIVPQERLNNRLKGDL